MENRRKFTRIDFDGKMQLRTVDGEEFSAHVDNICLKGVFIRLDTQAMIAIGSFVDFSLVISDSACVTIEGVAEIVWKNDKEGYGLIIREIDSDSFTHLKRLVEMNFKDAADHVENDLKNLIQAE